MSYQDIARHLVSGDGRLVAAAALFVFVWVLKSNVKIRDRFLTTPSRRRAAVALLAAIPAAALALTDSGVSLRDVMATFLTALFGAMGLNAARPAKIRQADDS